MHLVMGDAVSHYDTERFFFFRIVRVNPMF